MDDVFFELSEEQKEKIRTMLPQIKSKRARFVIERILEQGFVTTEDIEKEGYKHPPRAARDVREAGIPLVTFRVKSGSKTIAAYRFGNLDDIEGYRLQGRSTFPKELKKQLYRIQKGKCAVCGARFEAQYLQIDHRIPYEIDGEANFNDSSNFMLLCGSCNRAKSWSCEHCPNWKKKNPVLCQGCYWAFPENYFHIATIEARRIDILFVGDDEVATYEQVKARSKEENLAIPEFVKRVLKKMFGRA